MKKELRGFTKIFAFTFRQQTRRKGYLATTIVAALLCFLIPAAVLAGSAWSERDGGIPESMAEAAEPQSEDMPETTGTEGEQEAAGDETAGDEAAGDKGAQGETASVSDAVKNIFVVNLTGSEDFSAEALRTFDYKGNLDMEMPDVVWKDYGGDLEKADADSAGTADTLILAADMQGNTFVLNLLIPEGSGLKEEDAYGLTGGIAGYGDWMAARMTAAAGGTGGSDNSDGHGAGAPDEMTGEDADGETGDLDGENPADAVRPVLTMIASYLNIMVLYFFVLLYGQGVAQSVITEKSSKLMEFFLVSVRPAAMILGKITAICLSGVLQLFSWLLCLAAGFAAGSGIARAIDPETDMVVLQVLDSFGAMAEGMFSVGGVILALLLLLSGMLLYCALAGIGGAIAGKSEDLSSTNVAFTMILIASFFACLLAGGLDSGGDAAGWLDWIPFTAIMVTPARVLLGSVSLLKGAGCLLVIAASALLLTLLAGRLYKLMALYRGQLPGPKRLVAMLRSEMNTRG